MSRPALADRRGRAAPRWPAVPSDARALGDASAGGGRAFTGPCAGPAFLGERASRAERGSASLWLLGVGLAVVLVGAGLAHAATAVVARHRAEAAADFGALAAATRAATGTANACAFAATIVHDNGARLAACRLDGLDAVVTAEVDLPDGLGPASGGARAGPVRVAVAGSAGGQVAEHEVQHPNSGGL